MRFSNRIGPDILRSHWMLFFRPLKKLLYGRLGSCGKNVDIRPYVSLIGMNNIHLGDNVVLRPQTTIISDNNQNVTVTIEADALIGPGVYITSANHRFSDPYVPIHLQGHKFESVLIKRGAWLGYGVVVLPGVTIGEHAVVGAGAVVTRDIPPFCVAVGVPARVVKNVDLTVGQGVCPASEV